MKSRKISQIRISCEFGLTNNKEAIAIYILKTGLMLVKRMEKKDSMDDFRTEEYY
jgi:hypothetical protein